MTVADAGLSQVEGGRSVKKKPSPPHNLQGELGSYLRERSGRETFPQRKEGLMLLIILGVKDLSR